MLEKYRLMIYFAIATLHLYSKDVCLKSGNNVKSFRKKYPGIVKRVSDESLTIFTYELSWEQMDMAIYAYICGTLYPQDISKTEVWSPEKE